MVFRQFNKGEYLTIMTSYLIEGEAQNDFLLKAKLWLKGEKGKRVLSLNSWFAFLSPHSHSLIKMKANEGRVAPPESVPIHIQPQRCLIL